MKIETLKDNRKKKGIIIAVVVVVLVVGVATLTTSLAKFQKTQSIPIVRGKISYQKNDLDIVAVKLEQEDGSYTDSNDIPTSGYIINKEQSICIANGENIITNFEYKNNQIYLNVSKKGTKCYLFFDKSASSVILSNKTISERQNFNLLTINTTGTMYQAEDDDGTSYYYAGAVDDNWLKFGQENGKDIYWRIVRVNGNGSIRIIYAGTDSNVTTGTGTQISNDGGTTTKYKFNSSYDNSAYVGFMYTNGQVHGLTKSSTIKSQLDTWYEANLKENYEKYIDMNVGFYGDRTTSTDSKSMNGEGGSCTSISTYFGSFIRFKKSGNWLTNPSPTYKIENYMDLYTTSNSNKGNRSLTNPVGLITADEIGYAGGTGSENNTNFYLYTNQNYWTISPSDLYCYGTDPYTNVLYINSYGKIDFSSTGGAYGVRPVINLRADSKLTGSGTATDPYVIAST